MFRTIYRTLGFFPTTGRPAGGLRSGGAAQLLNQLVPAFQTSFQGYQLPGQNRAGLHPGENPLQVWDLSQNCTDAASEKGVLGKKLHRIQPPVQILQGQQGLAQPAAHQPAPH